MSNKPALESLIKISSDGVISMPKSNKPALKVPIKIKVSSGGVTLEDVMAASFIEAFELFLDKTNPKYLGALTEFVAPGYSGEPNEHEDDYTYYVNTVTLLKDLGRMD